MKILSLVARILLGVSFLIFGLNIFLQFLHQPPQPPIVNAFMAVMVPTGWMKVVGACQVLGGGLVLFDGTAPLGMIVLCPITVNILLFHICLLGGQGILPGLLTAILEMILISHYRANFAPIMGVKAY